MLNKKSLLIFPTQRAIRAYLDKQRSLNTLLPTCLTIDDFLKKAIYFEDRIYCDEEQITLLLHEAVKDIDIKKLGISSSFTKFLSQGEYIYRFFLEISSENIEIFDIKTKDTYEFYSEHLTILGEILKNYKALLDKNFFVDRVNLRDNYKINRDFIDSFLDITIFFEGYFTKTEFEIIEKISKIKELKIELSSNIYNQKSMQIFKSLGFDLQANYRYLLDISTKKILEEELQSSKQNRVEIKGFSTRLNQISYIKSTIVSCVNSGINPQNIAVVLPDEAFSKSLELFDSEKYFNFAMGKDILNKSLYQKANAIYNYILEDDRKNIEILNSLDIDKKFVDENIRFFWNKTCKKESFSQISDYIKSDLNDNELLEKYDELLYKLQIVLFSQNFELKLKDIYKIFLQKLAKIKLDDAHSGKVTVLGVLETRLMEFDAVIVCDFNDSFIPKISLKDKFLSTKVKFLANLPTKNDRENLQKYYYKRLLSSSKNVFISYVNSNENSISKFAYELFGNIDIKSFDEAYTDILYRNRKLEYIDETIFLNVDLTKQTWSASSLKTFLECKRRWYLRYILNIKEHSLSWLPKAFELGDIIHKVLEEFYKNENRDLKKIDEIFLKYRSENPFLTLDLEVYRQKIVEFLKLDQKRLETRQILELERRFNTTFNGFKINGIIDRVDKFEDSLELIDYKTSRTIKIDTEKNYEKSCDFQLEFYFIAIKELYQNSNIKAFYYDLFENSLKEEVVLEQKLELLKTIFDDLKEQSKDKIDFCKTDNKANCEYCIYKTICDRD